MSTKKMLIIGGLIVAAYWLWKRSQAQVAATPAQPSGGPLPGVPIVGSGLDVNPLDPAAVGIQFGLQQATAPSGATDVFPQGGLNGAIAAGVGEVLATKNWFGPVPLMRPQS